MEKQDCVTLDYLEFFCQKNSLLIGCARDDEEVWISSMGPHPSDLTSEEVREIVKSSAQFEIRAAEEEDWDLTSSHFMSRAELETQIRRLVN